MDRFAVIISGSGPHHSAQATDIDALLATFVATLIAAGHDNVRCTLTTNATDEHILPATPVSVGELAARPAKAALAGDR